METNLENLSDGKLLKLWALAWKDTSLKELEASCYIETHNRGMKLFTEALSYLNHFLSFKVENLTHTKEIIADLHIESNPYGDIPYDVTVRLQISFFTDVIGFLVSRYDKSTNHWSNYTVFTLPDLKTCIMSMVVNKKEAADLIAVHESLFDIPGLSWAVPAIIPFDDTLIV